MNFFVAQTSIAHFFWVEKLNTERFFKNHAVCYIGTMPQLVLIKTLYFGIIHCISIYKSIIIIFLVNLPLVYIYKFRKKEIQLQPPGEPREHRLGEVRQGQTLNRKT